MIIYTGKPYEKMGWVWGVGTPPFIRKPPSFLGGSSFKAFPPPQGREPPATQVTFVSYVSVQQELHLL